MKYYIVEPTYKKSTIEITTFRRYDEDGKLIFLRKELGWRWGSFLFSVPETDEEIENYLESCGYENILDWASDYGFTVTDDSGEEMLDPDTTVQEMIQMQCLPSEGDDFVDITEDYPNAEMIETWDGCWEYFNVLSHQKEMDEEEAEALAEEAEEAYFEGNEEAVEELGWEYLDTFFEIHCNPQITPCDENGTPLEEEVEDA